MVKKMNKKAQARAAKAELEAQQQQQEPSPYLPTTTAGQAVHSHFPTQWQFDDQQQHHHHESNHYSQDLAPAPLASTHPMTANPSPPSLPFGDWDHFMSQMGILPRFPPVVANGQAAAGHEGGQQHMGHTMAGGRGGPSSSSSSYLTGGGFQQQQQQQGQPWTPFPFSPTPALLRGYDHVAGVPGRNRQPQHGDKIIPPSPASGGVPEPTPEYILRASFLPQPSPTGARPLLVVIDLNGTLLYRPNKRQPSNFRARPHAEAFLNYCINTFKVVIWSSARFENVDKMCAKLLTPEQYSKVVAVWGRDRFGLTNDDYMRRVQCYKRLTRLWKDPVVSVSHPFGEAWNQGNTVLIDDSIEKARSEPHNAITIPEFSGNMNENPAILPLVHDYLNTLSMQMDVSTYIRANRFRVETASLTQDIQQADLKAREVEGEKAN